ncbi:MAG: transcription termination/antitermination protein NusA [Deltaproteobacteria bacterium]|nr:transcription termination/antitermination protein NusA [Deltaproteobacteria bacterium]
MGLNISKVVDQIVKEKGLKKEDLIDAIEAAVLSAAKKVYGDSLSLEAQYNPDIDEVEIFQFKVVTDQVTDPHTQILLHEARQSLDPNCQIGDELGAKLDASRLGRIAAQSAKQTIIQKVKDAERDAVYDEFISRKFEVISGFVHRFERRDIVVNLGKADGILREKEQIPGETFRRGDRIQVYILDVTKSLRTPQIELSRTHPRFLVKLFEIEVPEVAEGTVEIVVVAREPGVRAKIAVRSHDTGIDPVGTCVGVKGARVQNIIQELRGERLDIIPWSEDTVKFVCNALSPARVTKVIVDNDARSMDVVVPNDQLSLAIGRKGQNVRLVAKLTGWRIDVRSEETEKAASSVDINPLFSIDCLDHSLAERLYDAGYKSVEALAGAKADDLVGFEDVDEDLAQKIISRASSMVNDT